MLARGALGFTAVVMTEWTFPLGRGWSDGQAPHPFKAHLCDLGSSIDGSFLR